MILLRQTRYALGRRRHIAHFHVSPAWWAARKVLQRFKLADIGEGITECEVIKWYECISSIPYWCLRPLCEVQSDKASVEITSPYDGTVKEILVQEGQIAKVGEDLGIQSSEAPTSEHRDTSVNDSQSPPPFQEQKRDSQPPSSDKNTVARRLHPLDPNASPPPASEPRRVSTSPSSELATTATAAAADVLALPAVRHFARENKVDVALLAPGSGKNGRVERIDVERYLTGGGKSGSLSLPLPGEGDIVVELARTRYGMWKAMEKSLEIPHFGYSTSLDLTALHNLLPILSANIPHHYLPPSRQPTAPQPVSPSSFFPLLLYMHALSTPTGLYTPTVRAVDTHTVYSLAAAVKHLAYLGRQVPCALTPAELPRRGGTLTVSNIGAIGAGESAMPLLVPGGGVAIVALGRARWVWDVERGDGKGERRLVLGISWAADHRVVEGAELAAFVETWRGYVEQPERMIGEGV
ncbi:2-oxoacid dehydrogenases acyltransferase-domain-containing protein [Russula vinacea]|nr:2-oxoacid dehydrogenases acyltransferase-domain-containing protein [Russula vinacea]